VSQPNSLIFACTSIKHITVLVPRLEQIMLRPHHAMCFVQTTNKGYWRKFGCFRVLFLPFEMVLPAFCGKRCVFAFEILKFFRHAKTFFFTSRWGWE